MRRLILALFICLGSRVSAQDLIYTIFAETGGTGMSLDSILVENISNHKRLLFGNLPPQQNYLIDLTQQTLSETTSSPKINEIRNFNILTNQPGILTLKIREGKAARGNIAVYNLEGQEIFKDNSVQFSPSQSVTLKIGIPGIYLVRVTCGTLALSLKTEGFPSSGNIGWYYNESTSSPLRLKSATAGIPADFQFLTGDSLRISVYKKSYYAYPKSFRIKGSALLPFVLTTNTSFVTGVSNAYQDLSGKAKLQYFDVQTGKAVYTYSGPPPGLKYGDVIVVESDSSGFLRKVTGSTEKEGLAVVLTGQASLNEVFVNKEVKLSTQWMDPLLPVNNVSTRKQISEAMTDNNGFSHPVKIIFHLPESQSITKNPILNPGSEKPGSPEVGFSLSLNNTVISDDKNISFTVEEGNISLASDAFLSFIFKENGRSDEVTKSDQGDLSDVNGLFKGQCNVKASVVLKGIKAVQKDYLPKKIIDAQKITFEFLVAGVPLWFDCNVDLYQRWKLSVPDNYSSSWSFGHDVSYQTGWSFQSGTGIFTPVSSCESQNRVTPLVVNGFSDAVCRISFFPATEFLLFGIPIMKGESQSFSEADYYGNNQSVNIAGVVKPFLAWNSLLYSGIENQSEAHFQIMGLPGINYGSGEMNCNMQNPWKSPDKLILQTSLPDQVNLSTKLNLNFRVTDNGGNAVSGCTVFIQGDGVWSDQLLTSNSNGGINVDWTVSSKPGFNNFKAQIFDADRQVISEVKDSVRVIDKDAYGTVVYDGKTYNTKKFGTAVWMIENLAYLPSVSSPTPGSNMQPYFYVPGYYGSNVNEAKVVPGYSLYGVMYNWPAATNGESLTSGGNIRGVCPPGWHLPGEKDWSDLWTYLVNNGYGFGGSGNQVAKAMASKDKWKSSLFSGTPGSDPGSNNSSEFSGLPGGYRCTDALNFTNEGNIATWWSSNNRDSDNAYHWGFTYASSVLIRYYSLKARGYFVRCVKD